MAGATSKDLMEALHVVLAQELSKQLREGTWVEGDDGKPVRLSPKAALLNVARQFLKDNNIEAAIGKGGAVDEVMDALAKFEDELPFPSEEKH